MCGRFRFTSSPEAVGRHFDLVIRGNFPPRYNVAPTQPIAVIRTDIRREREFELVRWGFIPSWANEDYFEETGGKPLINARGDTVAVKPTFRHAFRRRRCLVPADGFYEWRSEKGVRQPYLISPAAGGLFSLAGLWETARDQDGGEIDTAAIITTEAGTDLSALHSREPVVIEPGDYERWLDPDEASTDAALALIGARPPEWWTYQPVSTAVNNARNEGEAAAQAIGQREIF